MKQSLQPQFNTLNRLPMKSLKLAIGTLIASAIIPSQSNALQLTFELRANPVGTSPGVVLSPDFRQVLSAGPNSVIALELYAVVNGVDANNTNDAFLLTHGSFLSAGADGSFSTGLGANNVAPFNGGVAQSGVLANLDADPGLELGSLATIGTPAPLPWFIATTSGAPVFGTAGAGGTTAFLIGRTTYTLAGDASGQVSLSYLARNKTDGLAAQQTLHRFTLDNVAFSLRGNSPEIVSSQFLVTVPEPSAFGMVMLGALGLVGFRRLGVKNV